MRAGTAFRAIMSATALGLPSLHSRALPVAVATGAVSECSHAAWTTVPSGIYSPADALLSVGVDPTAGAIWAGGHTSTTASGAPLNGKSLLERWNGSAFSSVGVPTVSPNANVAAVASFNNVADAVGWSSTASARQSLTLHWDGSQWTIVASPDPSAINTSLYGITGVHSADEWAVGQYGVRGGFGTLPLALHFGGTSWSQSPTDIGVTDGFFYSAVAVSADDVWAVGAQDETGRLAALIEHWNGSTWSVVPAPNVGNLDNMLYGVAEIDQSDIWAVGEYDTTNALQPLVEHWDGNSWSVSASSFPGVANGRLMSVAASAGGDVWAVGASMLAGPTLSASSGVTSGLLAHYDGSAWSLASTAATSAPGSQFTSVATDGHHGLWLVGTLQRIRLGERTIAERLCPAELNDSGFSEPTASVQQGNDAIFEADPNGTVTHTITDPSGLGAFGSGSLPPGSSYSAQLDTAGTYTARDVTTTSSMRITVALKIAPASVSSSSSATITWGDAVPSGYAEEVQVRRPGTTTFVDWIPSTTATHAAFQPDAGTGTYTFRARLLKAGTTAVSGWSPAATLTAS
ncbi:MAG: hypothetical protein ACTHNU_15815 [Gaiellales bacterium]